MHQSTCTNTHALCDMLNDVPMGYWELWAESRHCRSVFRLLLSHHEVDIAALSLENQGPGNLL